MTAPADSTSFLGGFLEIDGPGGPAWFLLVILAVILIGPALAERARVAGVLGLLVGGFLIGPEGFDLIDDQQALQSLGTLGLFYLMFLAALELDLSVFRANRNAAVVFGALTFSIPLALATAGALLVGYEAAAAVLLGSICASHTLLTYPEVRDRGVAEDRSVAVAVGGTVITDTAALVVLAIVVGLETGSGNDSGSGLVVDVLAGLALLVFFCAVVLPLLARWFFGRVESGDNRRFVFVFLAALSGAVVAEMVGIAGIVGAFGAGLALNRFVPNRSPLMDRVEFFGAAFLIPIFVVSVGLLIVPSVLTEASTLEIAAILVGAVVIGKAAAAAIAGRRFGFSTAQVGTVFSLSVTQAAATLAAATVGVQIGLLGEQAFNAALMLIVFSVVVGSLAASRWAPRLQAELGRSSTPSVEPTPGEELGSMVVVGRAEAEEDPRA